MFFLFPRRLLPRSIELEPVLLSSNPGCEIGMTCAERVHRWEAVRGPTPRVSAMDDLLKNNQPHKCTRSVSGPLAERHPERQCSTGLWYITVSQDIFPPMAYWGIYMTQHARIHTSRTSSSTISSRWGSRIARCLCAASVYGFSVKAFFRNTSSNPSKVTF